MDSLDLIYIRKVSFFNVTPERRYCDVKSEREIFDLRNVVIIIIIIIVVALANSEEMYCLRFFYVRWHIDRYIKLISLISEVE